ncbi:MAG TPA: hypothetical protein VH253_16875 [Phycisphaerae bacterium]|nr:hypothetical protein [Phycisphaerae bacterium]
MRTALLMAIVSAFLLSLTACGGGSSETHSVIPGESAGGPPPLSQPAK